MSSLLGGATSVAVTPVGAIAGSPSWVSVDLAWMMAALPLCRNSALAPWLDSFCSTAGTLVGSLSSFSTTSLSGWPSTPPLSLMSWIAARIVLPAITL